MKIVKSPSGKRGMKPSQALEEGIKLDGPQAFGHYATVLEDESGNPMVATCAVGTMAVGWGILKDLSVPGRDEYGFLEDLPDITWLKIKFSLSATQLRYMETTHHVCPESTSENLVGSYKTKCLRHRAYPLSDLIIHLNDTHMWTREAIVEWLKANNL